MLLYVLADMATLADLQHTSVLVMDPRVKFFLPAVCVCALRLSGCLPGLRAWLREHLKPVHSGCEVWGRDKDLLKLQTVFISACVSLCVCVSVLYAYICVHMIVDH